MRRVCVAGLTIGALVLASCGEDGSDSFAPVALAASDAAVDEFLAGVWPEGASGTVAAVRDGELVHCEGFGLSDVAGGIEAGCDTVYDVMSMTKQFTAAAILKLEMLGKLRVSDPLSRFVDGVPRDKRPITLHHLLTHTAGLPDALGDDYEPVSRGQMLAGALDARLQSRPGPEHHYSNLGYSVLAAVVEIASGMSYEEFLHEELFEPAGMTQTGYALPDWNPDDVAVEFDREGEPQGRPYDHPWADDGPYWNLRGNGGLLSTPRDMAAWLIALGGVEVLDRAAKQKMFTPHVPEVEGSDSYYGYGWTITEVRGGGIATHNGGNGWSFGRIASSLESPLGVFWISNHAHQDGQWNLDRLDRRLTLGLAESLGEDTSSTG